MNIQILESFRYLRASALHRGIDSSEELSHVLLELWREFERSYPDIPRSGRLRDELAPLGVTRLERHSPEGYWWWEPQRSIAGFGGWFSISAAHFLPKVPQNHKCRRLHGHRFRIRLEMEVEDDSLSSSTLPRFYGSMKELLQPYQKCLLNDLPDLENPTAELLASSIFHRGREMDLELEGVEVWETSFSGCAYYGDTHFQAFKDFEVECAIVNEDSYEGRSLLLRLGIEMELDQTMGWTMDFARIKEFFRPCYQRLDHRNLSSLEGQDLSDLSDLAEWILSESSTKLPITSLRIEEEPGKGVLAEV